VAHVGSVTSHGGVITTGSPDTVVDVAGSPAIHDPPLEGVPILPIEAAAQALAELVATLKTEGLSLAAAGSALAAGIMRGIGNRLPVDKTIEWAVAHSHSSGEALGKVGMAQAKKRLGLETDGKYVDRYHGPDDLARDGRGKLTELEAKGANRDSTAVAENKQREKQSSKAKNRRRARQMNKKSEKIGQASNRQGGAYTKEEIDLWGEIKLRKGNKRHLSVHTNTETGQVRVFERDAKGRITRTLDDFKLDPFDKIKQAIERLFKP